MKFLRTPIMLLLVGVAVSSHLHGQLLFEETFSMPTPDITTQSGWANLTPGAVGSSVAPPYIAVNEGTPLYYPGFIESGVGNSAYMNGAGQDAQYSMTTSVTSGTLYLSFMLKVDSASVAGDFFWLVRNSSNHNRWRMWIKRATDTTKFILGISKGSSTQRFDTLAYSFGQTHLVVAKYDFATLATTDAKLSFWVNPPMNSFGVSEPPANVSNYTETTTGDFTTINRFALIMNGVGTAPTLSIAGIRLATDWKTAVPAPPLYYNGTTAIDDPSSWGTNLDGTGTHPVDFGADNQLYLMRTPTSVSLTGFWLIGGIGSKLIIGNGSVLTIGVGGFLNGTVDVSTGGKLVLTGGDWPTIGNNAGIVSFDNPAGVTLIETKTLPLSAGSYDLTRGNLSLGGFNLVVKGRLRTLGNVVTGSGSFTLDSAGTLLISSPDGITKSAAFGDIRTTTRSYSRYANYVYMGTTEQVTGDGIPDTVASLSIAMASSGLTASLTKSVVVTGNLNFSSGRYRLHQFDLTFGNLAGHSDSSYVATDSTGVLLRPISNMNRKTMPVGSLTEFRPAVITYESTPLLRNIGVRYVGKDPGSAGYPTDVTSHYAGGSWVLSSDSAVGGTYRLDLSVPPNFGDTTKLRVLWRANSSTAWDFPGSVGTYSGGTLIEAGIGAFGEFAIGSGASAPPPPPGKRYESEVFATHTLQSDIQFGVAPSKTLFMDLFTGTNDSVKNRPLVIFIHGGGFKGGDKVSNFGTLLCGGLAKRGYVVASINYRTTATIDSDTAHFEAMLKALQDAKAAVRYFRANAATYDIDPNQIFATGSSAGSITALHLAYLDSAEVPAYVNWSNVGSTFEGTSGTPGVSSRIKGVISNWGAIGDTTWMKPNDPPVYAVHGLIDSTVFFEQVPADGPFKYGSKHIIAAAQRLGIPSGLRTFSGTGHTLDNNVAKQDSAYKDAGAWLYGILDPATTSVDDATSAIPSDFGLMQNYPNPFNPATTIRYQLPTSSDVVLTVFNMLGQTVATLVNSRQPAGDHAVSFDASGLASGLYLYRLQAGGFVRTQKMVLVK